MTKDVNSRASDLEIYERAWADLRKAEPSPAKIAATVGLSSRQAVIKWRWRGIPWEHMDALEKAYGIPRWQLNPIIYQNPFREVARWEGYFAREGITPTPQPAAA
jgi:hypothetical protein